MLSHRRRVLLTLASYGTFGFDRVSFPYVYNSLIPQKRLPDAYQEVEYIESTGIQYIDSGVVANSTTTFDFSFMVQSGSKAKLFGSRIAYDNGALAIYFNNSGVFTLNYGDGYEEPQGTFSGRKINIKSKINGSTYNIYVNDTLSLNSSVVSTFYSGNILLCAYNNNGTPALSNQTEQLKLYSCQISNNGTLVRNFVPCYRKADSVIGLYDIVNDVFYTNQGTGTFLKGKDVSLNGEIVKGKVAKIEGNSVVENQLCSTQTKSATTTSTSPTSMGSISLNFDSTHKYIVSCIVANTSNASCRMRYPTLADLSNGKNNILVSNTSSSNLTFQNSSSDGNSATTDITDIMVFDLTKMFPFDTPTTLTDKRVQNLLNRGYIEYNNGSLKNVNMGELWTGPYNLFDGVMEIGSFTNINTYNCKSTNYTQVLPNTSYTFENGNLTTNESNGFYYREYDENFNQIGSQVAIYNSLSSANKQTTFTTQNGTCYIKFFLYINHYDFTNNLPTQLSIHRTGTRTGFAKHKPNASIPFIYQGGGFDTNHNTMEITQTNVIFTKRVADYTYSGNETFSSSFAYFDPNTTGYYGMFFQPNNFKNSSYVLGSYPCEVTGSPSKNKELYWTATNIGLSLSVTRLGLTQGSLTENQCIAAFKNYLANNPTTFEYILATPQVFRIPRKHLGIVDLGSLTYSYDSYNMSFFADLTNLKLCTYGQTQPAPNIYCEKYMTKNTYFLRQSDNKIVSTNNTASSPRVFVKDTSYSGDSTGASKLKADLQGQYLFYETAEEVDDIATRIFTENGGTISVLESLLPQEYQKVEYIESSGTQYIDTGFNDYGKFVLDVKFAQSSNRTLCGYGDSALNYFDKQADNYYGLGGGVSTTTIATNRNTVIYTRKNDYTCSLTIGNETTTRTGTNLLTGYNFKLLGGIEGYTGGSTLYSCKIYNSSNVLIRNFVPCYRKSDNVIGLYDLVGKQFYTNSGSGTFTKGSDVTNYDYCEVLPNLDLDLPFKV